MADYAEGPFERIVNVGWNAVAQKCAVFAVDFVLSSATQFAANLRVRANGPLPTLPNLSVFGANIFGGMQEGDRDDFTRFQLSQQYTPSPLATVCNGGDTVDITEGGELTITAAPRNGVPVPDFRALERFWPLGIDGGGAADGDITALSTCFGDGAAGRWTQSTACGELRSAAATFGPPLQNNILNVDQRQLLVPGTTASSNDVVGHQISWPAGVVSEVSDRVWFVRTQTFSSGAPSSLVPAMIPLRRGSFVATVDGFDWYEHADMPGECIFNWPPFLQSGTHRLLVWYTIAAGEGADKLGLGFFGFSLAGRVYSNSQ